MNIEVKVDTKGLEQKLADFPEALDRARRKALMDIGSEIESQAELSFKYPQFRPSPWAPRKNNADPGRPLLYKHGELQQNFRSVVTGPDTVVVGTKVEYARYHQTGTKHMPARPFFPIDRNGNLLPRVLRKIAGYFEKALSEELRKIGLQ